RTGGIEHTAAPVQSSERVRRGFAPLRVGVVYLRSVARMSSQSTMISPEGVTPLPSTGAPPPAAGPARGHVLPPGTVIHGRYAIERILGSGGMATVYLARHIEIGARLAIKVLHEELSAVPMAAEHFLNEARGMSRIQHPHVVAVSDYGKLDSGV